MRIIEVKVKKPVNEIIEVHEKTQTKRKSVLVIDDDAALLELNKTILEMEDFEVFIALSGAAALSILEKIAQPDLILLDMRMEDMSGPEFLLTLEKIAQTLSKVFRLSLLPVWKRFLRAKLLDSFESRMISIHF